MTKSNTHSILLAAALFFTAILGLPLLIGVWLPDLMIDTPRILAEQRLASGYSFRVTQRWNHFDFYSTELHIVSPDGRTELRTLDGDDGKTWRVPLAVDEHLRTATVTLRGGRVKTVAW